MARRTSTSSTSEPPLENARSTDSSPQIPKEAACPGSTRSLIEVPHVVGATAEKLVIPVLAETMALVQSMPVPARVESFPAASGPARGGRPPWARPRPCRHGRRRTAEFVSDGAGAFTGYPAIEFIAHRVHYGVLIHPDDQARVREAVQAALAARDRYSPSYRIIAAGGSARPVRDQGRGVHAPAGTILGLDGFITDASDLHTTAAEASGSVQRYRPLFAANPNPTC